MAIYLSSAIYIQSQTTMVAKLDAIDAIINALMLSAATAATKDGIEEYWLNDGQTQIKEKYRSTEAIMKSIEAFERLRQMYLNRLNGRMVRLMDSKNFLPNRNER